MDFFKKKEPTIVADVPVGGYRQQQEVQPVPLMPGAGGLSHNIDRVLALEEENNRILKRMQTVGRWSFWIKVVVWALVLGLPVIFFQQLVDLLKAAIMQNPALIGMPSQESFQHFLEAVKVK